MGEKKGIILFVVLFAMIDICSATEIGIQPNTKGDTIIDQNTSWDGSNLYCGGNINVGNSSQKIDFIVRNSHVTVNGKWTIGGNNPVNFTLINSTVLFDVQDGISTLQPQNAIINTTQAIIVEDTYYSSKASKITLKNSTIKGKDYSHLAGGLNIKSGGSGVDPKANHTVIVDNMTFEYMGGLLSSGHAYYAFQTGQLLSSDSILRNISLNNCGRGMVLCSNIGASNVTSNGGFLAFISGKNWNHLYMNKTIEGLYNPAWGAWIGNSYFDGGETKLNIMSSSNVIFEKNKVFLAAFNVGDGSYDNQGNNNTLINNEFIKTGVASRKNGTKILNNTFYRGMPSGGNVPIRMWGFNFSVMNNEITEGSPGILVQPHIYYKSAGGHLVQNNIINRSGVGISIVDEYDNKFINNTIKNIYIGAGIQIKNSTNQTFYDTSIINTSTYDIYLMGGNDNITFVNTNFDENKIGFSNSRDIFRNYYYLDVKVIDSNGNSVSGTTVDIKNDIDDVNYKPVNINIESKKLFITKEDGHTPLPSDEKNYIALLDFWQNKTQKVDMIYSITASKVGYSKTVMGINPDSSWYHLDPDTPTYTVTIVLPTNSNSTAWDVNKDDVVNFLDINIIAQNYGTTTKSPYLDWDVNQDGVINLQDLILVESHFGEKVN